MIEALLKSFTDGRFQISAGKDALGDALYVVLRHEPGELDAPPKGG